MQQFTTQEKQKFVTNIQMLRTEEGMTLQKACKKQGINVANFYHWKNRFKATSGKPQVGKPTNGHTFVQREKTEFTSLLFRMAQTQSKIDNMRAELKQMLATAMDLI